MEKIADSTISVSLSSQIANLLQNFIDVDMFMEVLRFSSLYWPNFKIVFGEKQKKRHQE